jgi:ParB family chromosome partitioning protein
MSAEKKSRLGRGLEALLTGGESSSTATISRHEIPVDSIEVNPNQPRKTFDEDELTSLGESIKHHGVLQPLVVRQVGERYQLIAGERRLRAAESAGLMSVPVTVVDFNDQQCLEAALVENIQRSDLNPIEKALGFSDYLARYSMTHDQLAGRLGLARSTITNLVALLDLPESVQKMIWSGALSAGHAKALKGISDPTKQEAMAREIIARGMSVHATEAHLQQIVSEEKDAATNGKKTASKVVKTAHVNGIEEELRHKFGMKVEVKLKAKDKGKLILTFESNDDFERVLEALRK